MTGLYESMLAASVEYGWLHLRRYCELLGYPRRFFLKKNLDTRSTSLGKYGMDIGIPCSCIKVPIIRGNSSYIRFHRYEEAPGSCISHTENHDKGHLIVFP